MNALAGPTGSILGARVITPDGLVGEVWAWARPPGGRERLRDRYPYTPERDGTHVWVALEVPVNGEIAREHAVADLAPKDPADAQPDLFEEETA